MRKPTIKPRDPLRGLHTGIPEWTPTKVSIQARNGEPVSLPGITMFIAARIAAKKDITL